MKIDFLRALETFVAVAETRNMTAAAQSLSITQSAVSQQLHQLELDLGRPLVDRSVRPVDLTTAGMHLHAMASQLVNQATEIRSRFQDMEWAAMPSLRIAVIRSLAGTLVPDLVATLSERLSVQDISVWMGLAKTHLNALLRREVDFLFTTDPLLQVENLERYELYGEPFVLVTPIDFDAKSKGLAQLADSLPFIRYTRRDHTHTGWAIEAHLRRLRLNLPDNIQFDSPVDIIAWVAAGRGWAISTPSSVLHGMRAGDKVNLLPLPKPGFRQSINLVARSGEMGEMPRNVAELCCGVIAKDFVPKVRRLAPWLEDQLEIGQILTGEI